MFRSTRTCGNGALCLLAVLLMAIFAFPPAPATAVMLISPSADSQWREGEAPPKTDAGPKVQARLSQCDGAPNALAQQAVVTSARVPILMYHHVRPIDFSTSDRFTSDLTLPPAQLELQLDYLKANGFTTISLHDLEQHLRGCVSLPARPIALSFDDGYTDNYSYAFPLLLKYGFKGTFFVITGMVGVPDHMTWDEVKALSSGGMEIGAHTISHPDLARLSQPRLDQELAGSKKALEDTLKIKVDTLSYPSGSYNQATVAAARNTGYTTAVTTKYGSVHRPEDALELLRVRIHGTDNLSAFKSVILQQTAR